MECNADGSILRVKELQTDFVIPKKKPAAKDNNAQYSKTIADQNSVVDIIYSVLDVVDETYPTQNLFKSQNSKVFQEKEFERQYNEYSESCGEYPQNRGIKRPREKARTAETIAMTYKNSFGDLHDPSLPPELKKLMQPLSCQLCPAALNSSLNARMHYTSKNHDKKIKRWLRAKAKRTGEPLHKRAQVNDVEKANLKDIDPKYFYCEVCDLPLTGKVHADSHYMGKNHLKAVSGKRAPSGNGYYNEEGKWIRTLAANSDTSGRAGFGLGFILSPQGASLDTPPPPPSSGALFQNPPAASISCQLRCDMCNVAATSLPQMELHLNGHKHLKRVRQVQVQTGCQVGQLPAVAGDEADGSHMRVDNSPDNFSKYRTPSGHFYCKICDTSVNSELQFTAHLNSKKHLKRNSILLSK